MKIMTIARAICLFHEKIEQVKLLRACYKIAQLQASRAPDKAERLSFWRKKRNMAADAAEFYGNWGKDDADNRD